MEKGAQGHSKDFRYDKTCNFGVDYVFRSLRDDEPAEDRSIIAKGPGQDYHPNAQVCQGGSLPTQWISATKSLGVALKYGVENAIIGKGKKPNVAIIKVVNTNAQVIDVQLHNKGNAWKKNTMANCFARRSQEVLFENSIDNSAVVAIIGEKERNAQRFYPQEIGDLKSMGSKIMKQLEWYERRKEYTLHGTTVVSAEKDVLKVLKKEERNLMQAYKETAVAICDECDKLAYKYVQQSNYYMVDLIYEGGFNSLKDITERAVNDLELVKDKRKFFDYEVSQVKDTRGFDYEPEIETE